MCMGISGIATWDGNGVTALWGDPSVTNADRDHHHVIANYHRLPDVDGTFGAGRTWAKFEAHPTTDLADAESYEIVLDERGDSPIWWDEALAGIRRQLSSEVRRRMDSVAATGLWPGSLRIGADMPRGTDSVRIVGGNIYANSATDLSGAFPALTTVSGSIDARSATDLSGAFPALTTVSGYIDAYSATDLSGAFPALTTAGSISAISATDLSGAFPALTTVSGYINASSATDLSGAFPALTTVPGYIDARSATDLSGAFPALTTVSGIYASDSVQRKITNIIKSNRKRTTV